MNRLPTIWRWVQGIAKRRVVKQLIDEELRFHIEKRTMENIAAGMSEAEAAREARKRFGSFQGTREQCRDIRGASFGEGLIQDVRFGIRMLCKNPGFTAIAVIILSFGIGATCAICSVLDAFVLHPVPGPFASQLSEISEFNVVKNQEWRVSPTLFTELHGDTNLFAQVAVYEYDGLTFESGDFLRTFAGAKVSPEFFEVFGAKPILGRTFTHEEGSSGQDQVLVISHRFWQERFGGKEGIVGTTVRLNDKPWTIIGVMPEGFEFPSRGMKFWRPMLFTAEQTEERHRWERNWWCVVRQRPEIGLNRVQAFMQDLGKRLEQENPATSLGWLIRAHSLNDRFVDQSVRRTLWGLLGALGLLLAVICATVAGLQSVRLASRRQELSIRVSLGANRWRIIRQLTVESLLLVAIGLCAGLIVYKWASGICLSFVPSEAPMLRPLGLNWRIVFLTTGGSLFLGLGFGILAALVATRFSLAQTLKQAGSTTTTGRHSRRLTSALVVGEVALALVLVISASLLVRSVWMMLQVDPGFEPKQLARVFVDWFSSQSGDAKSHINASMEFADWLRALPGTSAVGIYSDGQSTDFMTEGNQHPTEIYFPFVGLGTNDFFHTLNARLVAGRWFDRSDDSPAQNTVLVNERLAKLCWPGQSAIGKHLWMGKTTSAITNGAGRIVVGVVRDIRDWSFVTEPKPTFFEPLSRSYDPNPSFWIRTQLDHASLASGVRGQIKEVLPHTMEPGISWLEEDLYSSTGGQRLYATSLFALAGLGLILASLGIYGVLSYMVGERTREIALRMALGAEPSDVAKLIVRHGAWLMGWGLLFGFGLSAAIAKILQNQLFGIGPSDPWAWTTAGLVLLLAGTFACYLPARRAANVDPMLALRYE